MALNQPDNVFRYLTFSTRTIESLCHDQLYFANPADFNDPLDCQPSIESNSNRNTLRKILSELIRRRVFSETIESLNCVNVKGDNAVSHANTLSAQIIENELTNITHYSTDPEHDGSVEEIESFLLTSGIQSELLKQYEHGVCCFSSEAKNPLMWSHYGDQHNGICAGYSLERAPKPILHKVEYDGNRIVKTSLIAEAILDNNSDSKKLLDNKIFLIKAPDWEYENEWRILGKRGIQNSILKLKNITFGLRCPPAVIHTIMASFESRSEKIEFYKIFQVKNTFELKREIINSYEECGHLPKTARSPTEVFSSVPE